MKIRPVDGRTARKEMHKKMVRDFFEKNPRATKRDCANALGLHWITVSTLVDEINQEDD